jgi:N-acetylneuraminic acid mutarotase
VDDTLEVREPADSRWSFTGAMTHSRSGHTATLLLNGKVLVVGGNPATSAELYDPATGRWSPTAPMPPPHGGDNATLLPDGRVLVVGESSATLYNPTFNTWSSTAPLLQARSHHTTALLPDGKVLVMGGDIFSREYPSRHAVATAELYDPATGTWSPTAPMAKARVGHATTRLLSGKVLVVGGRNDYATFSSAEVYDPDTGTWSFTAPMAQDRTEAHAILLRGGKVLVVGGHNNIIKGHPPTLLSSAEVYDPDTGTWSSTAPMAEARSNPTTTWLLSDTVLVTGGLTDDHRPLASTEVYDPISGTWASTDSLREARGGHTATLLPEGKVLVAGGSKQYEALDSAELSQHGYFALGCAAGPSASGSWSWLLLLLMLPGRKRSS